MQIPMPGAFWPQRHILTRPTLPETVKSLLDGFLLALRAGGRSPLTVQWYVQRLGRLAEALGTTPAGEVTTDQIRAFLLAVARGDDGRPRSPTYIDGFRVAAGTFWAHLVREGHVTRSPMSGVMRIQPRARQLRTLAPAEVARLIEMQPARSALGVRNRAIIAMLFDTGIRVGELVTLRVADVDLASGYAIVRGKTGEGRVPLSFELRRTLLSYVQRARPRMLAFADPGLLFVGRRGEPMAPNAVNQMLRRGGRVAGIAQTVGPHLFRHTFATEYLRGGGDPFTLQAILRHRTATMTHRYVHVVMSDVQERHAAASPLTRLGRRVV